MSKPLHTWLRNTPSQVKWQASSAAIQSHTHTHTHTYILELQWALRGAAGSKRAAPWTTWQKGHECSTQTVSSDSICLCIYLQPGHGSVCSRTLGKGAEGLRGSEDFQWVRHHCTEMEGGGPGLTSMPSCGPPISFLLSRWMHVDMPQYAQHAPVCTCVCTCAHDCSSAPLLRCCTTE